MKELFLYNWQARDEWFDWCRKIEESELLKNRTRGPGGNLLPVEEVILKATLDFIFPI